jgi:hypothetical protein
MGTRLIISSEYDEKHLIESSRAKDIVTIEGYAEGESDDLNWKFGQFIKYLLAESYSIELIQKYLNCEGCIVYELDDV